MKKHDCRFKETINNEKDFLNLVIMLVILMTGVIGFSHMSSITGEAFQVEESLRNIHVPFKNAITGRDDINVSIDFMVDSSDSSSGRVVKNKKKNNPLISWLY